MPVILLVKMSLFRISKYLQFWSATMVRYLQVPICRRRRMFLYRGRKSRENYSKKRVYDFSLAEFLPGKKKESFFFLLASAIFVGHESSLFCSPDSV